MKQIRFFAFLVALTLSFSACALFGDPQDQSTESGTGDTEEVVADATACEVKLSENGTACYKIVIPQNPSNVLASMAEGLRSKLTSATGAFFSVARDGSSDGSVKDSKGEILIGGCNRTDSVEIMGELNYKDYSVVVTDNNIVIAAHEDSAMTAAVQYFINCLTDKYVTVENKTATLQWTGDYSSICKEYRLDSMTAKGEELSKYRIVYPSDCVDEGYAVEPYVLGMAEQLRDTIGRNTGYVLPICTDEEAVQPYEILIGHTNRSDSNWYYMENIAPDAMEYTIDVTPGKNMLIVGGGWFSIWLAIDLLEVKLYSQTGTVEVTDLGMKNISNVSNVPESKGDYRIMSYNVMAELNGFWYEGGIGRQRDVEIRSEIVTALIEAYKPTVIGMQEVFPTWYDKLSESLPEDYSLVPLRTDGLRNYNVIAYNKNEVKLIDHGYVTCWGQNADPSTDSVHHCVAWAVFEDLQSGERFSSFVCHLTVEPEEVQMKEAMIMCDVIDAVTAEYDIPVITMGDYNTSDVSDVSKTFISESGLARATCYGVDHIYYDGLTVAASGVELDNYSKYASDHRPVWADFNIA